MKRSAVVALFLVLSYTAQAQGSFQNLDFESANIPINPGLYIPFTSALPGWTGSLGPYPATEAAYNGIAGAFATVSIIDRNSTFYSNSVIAGNYTAAISAGFAGTGFVPTAIQQTGLIPAAARSLMLTAQPFSGDISALEVTFNGQNVPLLLIGTGQNFQTYAGDISAFAGLTGELRFTEQPALASVATTVLLDNILFSNQSVPEPSVLALSVLGAVLLFTRSARPKS